MPIVYNFIFVLNLRKRVDIVAEIAVEFAKELERIKNIARVNVTSAIELNLLHGEDVGKHLGGMPEVGEAVPHGHATLGG